jgi:hypothetical protein
MKFDVLGPTPPDPPLDALPVLARESFLAE